MLACVASGAGLAMIPDSVLSQLPGRERVHPLPAHYHRDSATGLLWRRDAFTPNVETSKSLMIEQADEKGDRH